MREALNGRPAASRAKRDYDRVIEAYRKVYYTAPTSNRADVSVVAVAELLAEEGRNFRDAKLSQSAIGQYEFLRREYPGSKSRVGALFAAAQIYADDLGDAAHARQTFEEFLKHYPHAELADDARQAIADLDAAKKTRPRKAGGEAARTRAAPKAVEAAEAGDGKDGKTAERAESTGGRNDLPPNVRAAAEKADAAAERAGGVAKGSTAKPQRAASETAAANRPKATARAEETPSSGAAEAVREKLPLVTGIRHWSTPDYTRVAVDLEQEVPYEVGRVPNPDRLFFDLHGTKLAPGLMGKEFEVGDGLLLKVRVAQYQKDQTRIVLDLGDIADYQVFLLPNPYRLIVDVHGKRPAASAKLEKPATPAGETRAVPAATKSPAATNPDTARNPPPASAKVDATKTAAAPRNEASGAEKSRSTPVETATRPAPDKAADPASATAPRTGGGAPAAKESAAGTSEARSAAKAAVEAPASSARSKSAKGPTVREAKPTAAGDRSLIRALGLKIGRIVVDAGHGGHDTGTIGPTGLMEKDLVLEVGQRLGKLLESRLGAEVVYTRDDDTFVPLETRTAIANREQADLFISVHANSSSDSSARGVETYYLNFTTSADALEVAARENAVSDTSIHELQDLVKKIALKEKVEESREFAADVQQSLRTGLSGRGASMRDRGVKKAPFIVLIGANMPSILAEISFLSNPADERRLKTADYRQKIAESLYRGVARYVSGLSGVKVASSAPKPNAPQAP